VAHVVTDRSGDQWSILLQEARQALANLRADDLEELAARAECMLAATLGTEPVRQTMPRPDARDIAHMHKQQRMLGDLLLATQSNLKALDSTRKQRGSRWVL
jgi:hypothetical protein